MLLKVIIVDDEPLICEMIASLIDWQSCGFQVAGVAHNGADAWKAIQAAGDIAVLITDIHMSPLSGLELMRKIHQTGMRIRVIVLSAYDDFQYLKEAMALGIDNYLLKPLKKEELTTTLEQIASSYVQKYTSERQSIERQSYMRTNVLNQIIANNYFIRDVKEKCELLQIRLQEAPFQVVIIDTIIAQQERSLLKERHLCQFALLNIAEELLGKREHVHLFGSLTGEVILLFTQRDQRWTIYEVNDLINHMIHNVEQVLKIQLLIIKGKLSRSWRTIHESYDSGKELLSYRYIVDQTTILDYTHEDVQMKRDLVLRRLGLDQISTMIEEGKHYSARELMGELEQRMKSLDSRQLDLWRSACVDWVRNCPQILQRMEIDTADIKYQFSETIQQLLLVDSIPKLWHVFAQAMHAFIELIENINLNKTSNIINDVKSFIDANYSDNLSLKYLADHFHISSSYLGKRFRQEVGETFNDYVNRIRINKAQHLLLTTRDSASDIGAKVGYIDPNYFYKQFKNYIGSSPTEFRKR